MKSFAIALFAGYILFPIFSYGQINDCADAEVVCSDADLAFNPIGPGINDFADPNNFPGCITSLEQNSAWYYFEIDPSAPPDLTLGFIIHPKGGIGEDYDWALFGPDVDCGNLGFPIRCSSSSAACGFCPDTGMGMGTTDFSEGPGTGDGFVSTLTVQPGQGFYLLIDNWLGTTNGFIMSWTDSAAPYLNCAAEPPCALSAIAGPNISACEGAQGIQLNGNSSGEHGNEMYSWTGTNGGTGFLNDPNIKNPTVSLPGGFSGTIIYTLTVMEGTCMGDDELELTVHPLPSINILQIGPFCPTDPPQTLSATPGGGIWGGAATGNMFNPMTNGPGIHNVTYSFTDNFNCTAMSSIDIEVHDSPLVEINPDMPELCDSEGDILLTATGSGGAGGYEYNWDTPFGTGVDNTFLANLSGQYFVTVTDANGCTNTDVTLVTFHENPVVEIIDPGPICGSIPLMTINATPPGGTFGGDHISSSGVLTPNLIPPGTYSINYNYFDGNDCEATDFLTYTIIPNPSAIASNNTPLCEGQQISLLGETDGTGTIINYIWEGPNGYMSGAQNPIDATEAGAYTLQVTVDGCPSPLAVTNVILADMPDALAINDGPYCNGQPIQLFGSTTSSGNVITYQWSGPNGYTSDVQNPTNATEAGIYSLLVTLDNCPSQIVATEVIFGTPPNATATNSGPYCQGDAIQLNGTTSTTGNVITYNWSGPNGYTSSVQNPIDIIESGNYQLTVNVDGCNSAISTTSITINSLPLPIITGQDTFCTGYSSILDAGAGYVTYLWDNGSQNQTLEVFSSGTHMLTVSDSNGCEGEATFSVIETPSLTPVISGLLSFCEGSGTMLDAGAGYSIYQWSTGETNQSIQVTTGGNIGVIVTDADGCTGSANITTTVNLTPNVTIGGSTTYCIGGFTILDAGAGYSSYLWNNTSTSQTITVSSPGIYSVDIIDNNGCAGSSTVNVTESTSLSPVITGNNAFCENGSTTLNAGSGFSTYVWSNGLNTQTISVTATGIYSVSVSDGQGCFGNTSISITEVFPPSAILQSQITLCNTLAGGSVINLYDLILAGDMNGSWEDKDQSGAVGLFNNLNFNQVPAGDYTFIYTTNSAILPCPETSYQITVTVMDCTCPDVLFFNAGPLCNEGDILDLATIENTGENGTWSLLQSPTGSNPASLIGNIFNATAGDPGLYLLQFSLQNQPPPGCPIDFQVMVNVDPKVDAGIATAPVSLCFNDNQILSLAGLISGEDLNGNWTETSSIPSQGNAFNPGNASFQTNSQVPGAYTFEYGILSIGACPDDATEVTVMIHPLPIAQIVDFGILNCTHTTSTLDAEGSSFGSGFDISWTGPGIIADGNENSLHPTINKPGKYELTVTNVLTGCINTASVDVIQNIASPSAALIDRSDPACFGDENGFIHINQVFGGTPPYLYSLNNQPFDDIGFYNNLSAGDYTIILEDANGCRWDTLMSIVEPSEINIELGEDIELDLGKDTILQAIINLPLSLIDTLVWTPSDLISCVDILCLEATIHTFNTVSMNATVYDKNGCADSDDVTIYIRKSRNLYFPTAFSPNGDDINDVFFISGKDFQIVKIKKFLVFNRWGEAIFEAIDFLPNDPEKGWDGSFKNEKMNPGVFVYFAEVEFIDGYVGHYTGDVTVMR